MSDYLLGHRYKVHGRVRKLVAFVKCEYLGSPRAVELCRKKKCPGYLKFNNQKTTHCGYTGDSKQEFPHVRSTVAKRRFPNGKQKTPRS